METVVGNVRHENCRVRVKWPRYLEPPAEGTHEGTGSCPSERGGAESEDPELEAAQVRVGFVIP